MRTTTRNVLRLGVFTVFTVAIAVWIPKPLPLYYRLAFLAYAWTCYGMLQHALVQHSTANDATPSRWWNVLLIGSFVFILFSRILPFIQYGSAPLGYDTGFYVEFYRILERMRTIHPAVITTSHLTYASWFPYILLKLPTFFTMNTLHVLHQLLTAGALYFFVRSVFRNGSSRAIGAITVFLFASSVNQFAAYWWMFYKQSMAIPFLLFALGLLFRRSWLAIPVAAFGAAIHLQSAVPFAIAFALFTLAQFIRAMWTRRPIDRDAMRIIIGFLVAAVIAILIKGPRELQFYLEYFLETGGTLSGVPFWRIEETKGLFIPQSLFLTNVLYWIPFAYIGVIHLTRWVPQRAHRTAEFLIAALITLIALTALPVIYQNRTLILLDFLLIAFAAAPLFALFARHTPRVIPVLVLAGALATTSLSVFRTQPQVTPAERRELEQIGTLLRQTGGYAMSIDAMYSPWVYLFTEYDTIAPGALNWNQWDLTQWDEFWNSDDDTHRYALLDVYGPVPIYLFIGDRQRTSYAFKRFLEESPAVTPWSPHVWRYDGASESKDAIEL
ncbi:hypothetical protein HY635_02670 [Candidatus Uhrbacteria bacterium]|nr:hypothetical protein [Candidatus Uhrbacteria bacterium]